MRGRCNREDLTMTSKPEILIWPGADSMSKLRHALQERRAVELVLSAGLHNAFYSRFEAEAPQKSEIEVDVQGGAGMESISKNFLLFERLTNVFHEYAPQVRLCFNRKPNDRAEAVKRWV
jgi:hypothetical protein